MKKQEHDDEIEILRKKQADSQALDALSDGALLGELGHG